MIKYTKSVEEKMIRHFLSLNEKDRRHYAAVEALKLGYGGKRYISQLFGISEFRIRIGIKELEEPTLLDEIPKGKQRRAGGGRHKTLSKKKLLEQLHDLIEKYKAGIPTDPNVYFIYLTAHDLSRLYYATYGVKLSAFIIRSELRKLGYKYRNMLKKIAIGTYKDRNLQFELIFEMVNIMDTRSPILSIDGKKKERLGNLYRDGKQWSTEAIKVFDHDYPHLSKQKVIPHGIYDLHQNKGYMSIGQSAETAEFIIDNLLWWWDKYGIHDYPDAKHLLLLCDSGGGNSYRHHAFKKELIRFAEQTGLTVIVCHYPPYASKWNPIEHRLFCHVHRAMEGVLFTSYEVVQKAMQNTSTKTGLCVVVRLNLKQYNTGIKTTKEQVDYDRIQYNPKLPKLNYKIAA
ncbi:MAG: ISAzo13 family transposase [Bacteroidota bacterium]